MLRAVNSMTSKRDTRLHATCEVNRCRSSTCNATRRRILADVVEPFGCYCHRSGISETTKNVVRVTLVLQRFSVEVAVAGVLLRGWMRMMWRLRVVMCFTWYLCCMS